MRILHTADWHLGRRLEGRDRLDEQGAVLDEIVELARREAIDLVLVAGDVFDTVNPPAEAESLAYDTFARLADGGRRAVLVIAGNHDSPERLRAINPLAVRQGLSVMGYPADHLLPYAARPQRAGRPATGPGFVVIETAAGERAAVLALPYPSEARLGELLSATLSEVDQQQAYDRRMATWLQSGARGLPCDAVRLLLSHIYVVGGGESDSERPIQMGGACAVRPDSVPADVQYAALGHLHRPQTLAGPAPIRYAGSPLAYSFSEAQQVKSVTIIDATPTSIQFAAVPLGAGRRLVRWQATEGLHQVRAWCEAGRDPEAWIDLEIHVDQPLTGAEVHELRSLHRGFVHIRPVYAAIAQTAATGSERAALPLAELFRLHHQRRTGGAEPPEALVKLFLELVAGEEEGDVP